MFWGLYTTVMIECIFVEGYRRFEWTCSLQLQGWKETACSSTTSVSLYKATRCNNILIIRVFIFLWLRRLRSAGDTAGPSLDSQINNSQQHVALWRGASSGSFPKSCFYCPSNQCDLSNDIAIKSLILQSSTSECKSELSCYFVLIASIVIRRAER
jgi:hypothetical protein